MGTINKCQILTHPVHLKARHLEFLDISFFNSSCVCQRETFVPEFLMHCRDKEVSTVLFIFYHNDKLLFVLFQLQ